MNELFVGFAAVGGLILLLGLLSEPIKGRLWVSEQLVALVVGVVLGPAVLGWMDPAGWGNSRLFLQEAARLTLAIGLMAVALRIPSRYVGRHRGPLGLLLLGVMPLMWLSTTLVVHLLLGLGWRESLLVAAIVTPTDPVVASAIVTGGTAHRMLPGRLRQLLSAESGLNDGLAYLLVLLPLLLLTRPGPAEALRHWVTHSLLREVLGGALLGVLLGWGAGRALCWSERKGYVERTSFLAYSLALSLLVVGVARLSRMDGILAVFISGVVFDRVVGGSNRAQEAGIQEAVSQFFTLPIFLLLGLALPWRLWAPLGWKAVALVLAVLLLRRLPALLLVRRWVRPLHGLPDALFAGWFGPIGVSALFYAMLAQEHGAPESTWSVASLVICASLVVHGATASPLTRLYGRHQGRDQT